jgi:uncharacterized protein YjbI with pentapeptide repeats
MLRQGVQAWNRWRAEQDHVPVDLSGADLSGARLDGADLLRADLSGARLVRTQLEHAQLKDADLTGAVLESANLEHATARGARFDGVQAAGASFEVATLRGARFRGADLTGTRLHRAYLRDADLSGASLRGAWLRLAVLEGARCRGTVFDGADLRFASLVGTDLRGAQLVECHVYGTSAWDVRTDEDTRQDLLVSRTAEEPATLRADDLLTAQLLALMLGGAGVRSVLDAVTSSLVLVLGSFAPADKPVLDAVRTALQRRGHVAVVFDFERPAARDYAETVVVLAGLSRFVVADFTSAREVRSEVLQVRQLYPRVPVVPIAREGVELPITMVNVFDAEQLAGLVRYDDVDDLVARLQDEVIGPAEARAAKIAAELAGAEALLRGASSAPGPP